MADAKVEFSIGSIKFSGEGDKAWVTEQLDKILEKAPSLLHASPGQQAQTMVSEASAHQPMAPNSEIGKKHLSTFLNEKDSNSNQNKKFLATAVWLEAKGQSRLEPKDIVSALKSASQTHLANPSQCLNRNVNKGYCEKDGEKFFVTMDGKNSL